MSKVKIIFLKLLPFFFINLFLAIFFYNSVGPVISACLPESSCPGGSYCAGPCDAWYDSFNCYCTCCYDPVNYIGCTTCGCGTCAGGVSCFLPGTKISTPDGEEKIEEIKAGDKIVTFDPETQEAIEDVVSESYFVTRDHYYVVKTDSGREVKTTDEHPFYTGKESLPAKSFKDKLINFYSMIIIYFKDGLQTVKTNLF